MASGVPAAPDEGQERGIESVQDSAVDACCTDSDAPAPQAVNTHADTPEHPVLCGQPASAPTLSTRGDPTSAPKMGANPEFVFRAAVPSVAPRRCSPSSAISTLLTLLFLVVALLGTPHASAVSSFRPNVNDATAAFRAGAKPAPLHAIDAADTLRSEDVTSEARRRLLSSPGCIPNLHFTGSYDPSASLSEGQFFMFADPIQSLNDVNPPAISPSGTMYLAASMLLDDLSQRFATLSSFDSSGALLWMISFPLDGYIKPVAKSVAVDALPSGSESVLVVGTCWTANMTGPFAWLASFNSNGTLNWIRVISEPNTVSSMALYPGWSAHSAPASLVLAHVPGQAHADIVMSSVVGTGSLVARFASNGSLLWASILSAGPPVRFNGSEALVIVASLALGPNGSVVAVGAYGVMTLKAYGYFGGFPNILVASWRGTGELLWAKALNVPYTAAHMIATAVLVDAGGAIVLTGSVGDIFYVAHFNSSGSFLAASTVDVEEWTYTAMGMDLTAVGGKVLVTGMMGDWTSFDGATTSSMFAMMLETLPLAGDPAVVSWAFNLDVTQYLLVASGAAVNGQGRLVLTGIATDPVDVSVYAYIAILDPVYPRLSQSTEVVTLSLNTSVLTMEVPLAVDIAATATVLSFDATGTVNVTATDATPSPVTVGVEWYTYDVNPDVLTAGEMSTALLMFPWQYTLPISSLIRTYPPVSLLAHPQLVVGAEWLSYNIKTGTFSGIPFSAPPSGKLNIPIAISPLATDVGTFTFPSLELQVCVDSTPDTFLLFISSNTMRTATGVDGTIFFASVDLNDNGFEMAALSPNGTLLWDIFFYYASTYNYPRPTLAALPGGGVVFAMGTYVGRCTHNGTLVWAKVLQGDWSFLIVYNLVLTGAGDVVLTGQVDYGNLFVAAVDLDGVLQWASTVDSGAIAFAGYGIALGNPGSTTDNSVVVVGDRANSAGGFVLALDDSGAVLWAYNITPGPNSPLEGLSVHTVDVDPSGGQIAVSVELWSITIPGVTVGVVVLTPSGDLAWEVQWVSRIQLPGYSCYFPAVVWLKDGIDNMILAASCGLYRGNRRLNLLLASVSGVGGVNWVKAIDIPQQDDLDKSSVYVAAQSNGPVVVGTRGLLAKLTQAGELVPAYSGGPHSVPYTCTMLSAADAGGANATAAFNSGLVDLGVFVNVSHPDDVQAFVPTSFRSGYLVPGALTPFVTVPFGKPLSLNLSQYLLPGVSVTLVQGQDGSSLPSWLHYDFNSMLTGSPFAAVRLLYPITLTLSFLRPGGLLVLGANSATITFNLNVPNTAPRYGGPAVLSTGLGSFGFRIEFDDAEGDTLYYAVGVVGATYPPPFVSISSSLGLLSGTTAAGDGGVYAVNVSATDAYGAVGWTVVSLHITEPSALQVAFEKYWPLLLSGILLFCVITSLAWRDNSIARADFLLHTVSDRLCQPERHPGCPSYDDVADMQDALLRSTVGQLDSEAFDTGRLLRDLEAFCAAMTAFAVKGFVERNFLGRLALSDFIQALLTFLDTRVVNLQLLELRQSREGMTLTYPVLFHRKTLLVIHVLNRVMETTLLCFSLQVPEAKLPPSLCAWLVSGVRRRLQRFRNSAGDRDGLAMRRGVSGIVARNWMEALGVASGHVAGPLGLPSDCVPVEVQVLHGLAYLRQAIVYLPDTNTAFDMVVSSLVNLLAPLDLMKDWMFIVSDVPQCWSLLLMEARLRCVGLVALTVGPVRQRALLHFQQWLHEVMMGNKERGLAGESDWRLVYGVTTLLGGLLQQESGLTEAEHAQVCGPYHDAVSLASLSEWKGRGKTGHWICAAARGLATEHAVGLARTRMSDAVAPALLRSTVHCFPILPNPVLPGVERELESPSKGLVMVGGWVSPL